MDEELQSAAPHYLRTPDGTVYGPVDIATLCTWATDARVIPGCMLSRDRESWEPVESFSVLRLNWSVLFEGGTTYGPLSLLAIWVLASEKSIPRGVFLVESGTGRKVVLDDSISPLLAEECRQVLAGCGILMADVISRLDRARQSALSSLADREGRVKDLEQKLEQAEHDLTSNLKLVAETQRRLAETAALVVPARDDSEARLGQLTALRGELDVRDVQMRDLQETITRLESDLGAERASGSTIRSRLGDVESALAAEKLRAVEAESIRTSQDSTIADLRAKLSAGIVVPDDRVALMQTRVDQQDKELAAGRADLARLMGQITDSLAAIGRMEAELREKASAFSELASARDQLLFELSERDGKLSGLQVQLGRQDSELSEARNDRAHFQKQLAEAAAENSLMAAKLHEKERLANELAVARDLLTSSLAERDDRLTSQQGRIDALEAESTRRQSTIADIQAKWMESQAAVGRLEMKVRDQESMLVELGTVRDELAAAKAAQEELAQGLQEALSRGADVESQLVLSRQALVLEQDHCRKEAEAGVHLRADLERLSLQLQEQESLVKSRESALNLLRQESEKQVSVMQSERGVLAHNLDHARQREESLKTQLVQARESAAKAQKANRAVEQKLRDELADRQRDLSGLMMASQCVKQVTGKVKPKPEPIDWMSGGGESVGSGTADDAGARFERLPVREKVVFLHREIQTLVEQKELMRHELETVKGRYEFLQNESVRKELEAAEKLAQSQKEIKTSTELVEATLREVEKRESVIRELRKKADARRPESSAKLSVLEAEVIHSEVLGPDEKAHQGADSTRVDGGGEPEGAEPPKGARILNSVEAQLQKELKHWETLKREKENNGGTLGSWFRRKKI